MGLPCFGLSFRHRGGVALFAVAQALLAWTQPLKAEAPRFGWEEHVSPDAVVLAGKLTLPSELTEAARGIRNIHFSFFDAEIPSAIPIAVGGWLLGENLSGDFLVFKIIVKELRVLVDRPPPRRLYMKVRLDARPWYGAESAGDLIGVLPDIPFGSTETTTTLDRVGR